EVSTLGAAAAAAYRPAKSSALIANTAPNRPHTSQRWHNELMAGRARDMERTAALALAVVNLELLGGVDVTVKPPWAARA
ncbi:MAG TPA: hypothetical protein VHP33_33635, partial [Polyangiaceae bacterium]|nr:hypothetical protein [Polyangiaceae bacterium]